MCCVLHVDRREQREQNFEHFEMKTESKYKYKIMKRTNVKMHEVIRKLL